MRNFLTVLIFFMCSLPVAAFENYMIVSDNPITSASVEDIEILDVKPIFTINNEKRFLIVTPKAIGETKLKIIIQEKEVLIDVKITNESTFIDSIAGFNFYLIDTPPEDLELNPEHTEDRQESEGG